MEVEHKHVLPSGTSRICLHPSTRLNPLLLRSSIPSSMIVRFLKSHLATESEVLSHSSEHDMCSWGGTAAAFLSGSFLHRSLFSAPSHCVGPLVFYFMQPKRLSINMQTLTSCSTVCTHLRRSRRLWTPKQSRSVIQTSQLLCGGRRLDNMCELVKKFSSTSILL